METSQVIVKGIIVPAEWNQEGIITGIAVATYDEKTVFIEDNRFARKLLGFLRKPVILSGTVSDHGAKKTIVITEFQIHEKSDITQT